MANRANNAATRETRQKLIEAAGNVFAERSYRCSTIRQITERAGTSLAAVNYHFKGKSELYKAVLDEMATALLGLRTPEEQLVGTAEEQLHTYVRYLVRWLISKQFPDWAFRLFLRETTDQMPQMKAVYERALKPMLDRLVRLIEAMDTIELSPLQTAMTAACITGQCIHFMNERPVAYRLFTHWPKPGNDPDTNVLADHVVQLALYGLKPRPRIAAIKKSKRPPTSAAKGKQRRSAR